MKHTLIVALVSVWFGACSGGVRPLGPGGEGTGGAPPAAGSGGAVAPSGMVNAGLTVHEWGTFTSVNSSAGVLMEGLHHEEEPLPAFVYGRGVMGREAFSGLGMKGLESQPAGVTQKLETPVLYFYGAEGARLRVRVDFPQGVISEWYPIASGFGPALGLLTVPRAGFMEWAVDLLPAASVTPADFPAVAPDDIWAPSRRVASLPVKVGAEKEQFVFYRGVGAFQMPISVDAGAGGLINIRNQSSDISPAVFLLRVHAGGGAIVNLGALPGGGSMPGVPSPIGGKEHNLDVYVADAQAQIATALEATGLFADEARAMVETWSKSYFRSYGLRILYVVPRAWTDALLPLTIDPAPATLVRTLVGRVELLAPSEESELLALVSAAAARAATPDEVIAQLGRLAEPKLRRVRELTADPVVTTWCNRAVIVAAAMP